MKKDRRLEIKIAQETLDQLDRIVSARKTDRPDANRSDVVRELIVGEAKKIKSSK
jgi:hypothetical protein